MEMGYMAPVQAFYDMSREWYANRMEEDWEPARPEEATALLARSGFVGRFWEMS